MRSDRRKPRIVRRHAGVDQGRNISVVPHESTLDAKTIVKMRNRVLGEYKEQRFITGFIEDKEFDVSREPFEAPCETATSAMMAYRQGERLTSRWLVQ